MCNKSGFVILSLVTISNNDHFLISPPKMQIGNTSSYYSTLTLLYSNVGFVCYHNAKHWYLQCTREKQEMTRMKRDASREKRDSSREKRDASREKRDASLEKVVTYI